MADRCLDCPFPFARSDGFIVISPASGPRTDASGSSRGVGPFVRDAQETGPLELKGSVSSSSQLPGAPAVGWTYMASEAGTYGGIPLQAGDLLVCVGTAPTEWAPVGGGSSAVVDASRLTGTAHVDTTGNAATADRTNHALTLSGSGGSSSFNGSAARTLAAGSGLSMAFASGTATLSTAASGVAPGSYNAVTVGADGRVTQGSNPSTLAGHGITDAYTKQEIDSRLTSGMHYKGNVATYADLPSSGQLPGDFWNVLDTGRNYAWDGTEWDYVGDLVDYAPITDAAIDDITEH